MTSDLTLEAELLRRYDRPGPRYTSYPTAPQFSDGFGEPQLREAVQLSNGDPIPRRLSLYLHVPFCMSPCFYCGCNRIITRDLGRGEIYLARLYREIELVSALFDRDREVVQLHFGGGTPNFLSPAQLAEAVDVLHGQFRFSDAAHRDISIELDPRFLKPDDVGELALATGLLDVALDVALDGLADGLAVGHLRLADVGLHAELALHAVDDDFKVQLAHARDDGLA